MSYRHDARLRRLEERAKERRDAETGIDYSAPIDPVLVAFLNAYSGMKAAMSDKSYRGSPNGPVKIEPFDEAREFYGRDYSEREFQELAARRALEGLGYSEEEIARTPPGLVALFDDLPPGEG